jgi:hypothetical protein
MWQVENRTPFAAAGNWTRNRDGAEVWLVAVRCTFDIKPDGTTVPAKKQEPPVLAPQYRGEPGQSSLIYDSDFYLTKPTTDVLLHGFACATGGKPAASVDVTMRVGDIRKTLRVTGDRKGGQTQNFVELPIIYERAYGGREPEPPKNPEKPQFEERNPVGTGFATIEGKLPPNIVYAGVSLTSKPAGFGPIPTNWKPRIRYAGTYDAAWQKDRMPLFPHDLDDRFFLCSPEDQQPEEYLRGGEPVELLNLTPSGRLSFSVPKVAFGFETHFRGSERVEHRGKLHTVIFEPGVSQVILVWRTELACHPKVLKLQKTVVRTKTVLN